MKKTTLYIALAGAMLLAIGSCSKEKDSFIEKPVVASAAGDGTLTVTLSVPDSPDTKTALGTKDGSSYPVKWSSGDQDRVSLNGSAPTASSKDSDTQISATFKPAAGLAVYNFLYRGDAGHDNQVTIPASQTYYANDFDDAAMPMYAASATRSNTVTFNSLCSLLKFSITGEKKIDSVTLTAADGSKSLSGTFTIGKTGAGLLNGTLTPASGGGSINFNFGSHIQLSDTPFVFYVAIPAGTYEGGITLDIVDNASGHMTATVMNTNATKTIAAGKVREFNNIVYIPDVEQNLKQIWNSDTFLEFVNEVAGGKKTLNARLTPSAASINLSGISFESIDGYKGTFDGNGKTLSGLTKPLFNNLGGVVKNLTLNSTISITDASDYNLGIFARQVIPSSEVDDIAGLQNCTAEGSITYKPSSAVGSMPCLGGLVGNNRGGTFVNCTNNATVTFADSTGVTHTGDIQPSIGGIVGRTQKGGDLSTQGDISNCTNAGTVSCAEQFGGNIMIGGVVGYGVEKAESISGCTNSGIVKTTATCSTSAALHIGGVMGMYKGTIESCSNLSGGVVTTEDGCTVGSYLNQGGVIGRMNNTSGTYSGLSNAGTVNVAATGSNSSGIWVGGVVGRCNEGAALTDITNSGSINYTATSTTNTFIGGIVSRITTPLSDCHATGGTISYTGDNAAGALYIGGVTGYTNAAVAITNCTSAMTINVGGSFEPTSDNFYGTGGIIGNLANDNATVSNCLNTGNITWSQEISNKGYSYLGGVVGRAQGSISDSSNGGTITFSGKNQAQNPYIGGLAADTTTDQTVSGKYASASASNYGNIVINTSVQSSKYVYVGGITGRARSTISNTTNAGQINVTSLTCTRLYLGGIAGTNTVALGAGNANLANGDITVSGLTDKEYYYIGGVVGLNSAAVSANNAGDVIVTSGSSCAKSLYLGGIVGRGEANISSSTNSGAVSNACPQNADGSYIQVGGIVGYNNGSSALSECTNEGDVSNSGSSKGYIFVGGITSESDADITSCHNTGDVSNSGEALTQKTETKLYQINVSGIAGHNGGATITSCYNTGAVSNSADSGAGIMVGGITGEAAGGTYVTCHNTGAISNTGFAYDSAERGDVALGGLVGFLNGDVIMTGTSAAYNYNDGPISESSTTAFIAVGGITGIVKGNCELSFVKNLADGDITCADNTRKKLYVGGCVGVVQRLFTMDDASNAGDLNFSNITIYNNNSSGALVGGVIGAFSDASLDLSDPNDSESETIQDAEFTFRRLTNSGAISCPDSNGNGSNMKAGGKSSTAYSYFGGISGVGDTYSKNFYDCTNTGSITVYNQLKTRLGGVLAYTNHNPKGCVCNVSDKILYYRYNPQSNGGNGEIGGIVGYCNLSEFEDLTFIGGLQTTGSSPNCYTGGIIGRTRQSGTFKNCKVGKNSKNIVGASSGYFAPAKNNGAGLFTSCETNYTSFDFTGCIVATGTKCQGTTITSSNLSSALIGRNQPETLTNLPTIGSW